jgi:hypothetical protein
MIRCSRAACAGSIRVVVVEAVREAGGVSEVTGPTQAMVAASSATTRTTGVPRVIS